MLRNVVFVAVTVGVSACLINPTLSIWESNDQGPPNACLPFVDDAGVGSGAVTGVVAFTVGGSHHSAQTPRTPDGQKYMTLELDEAGTRCPRSSQAEANRAKTTGTQSITAWLIAPADGGWEGTYTVGFGVNDPQRGIAQYAASSCQPFLGVLGDCVVPTLSLAGTLTIDAVTSCGLTGHFELVDIATDAGTTGTFDSVFCRGVD